jgi:hypothetical protein
MTSVPRSYRSGGRPLSATTYPPALEIRFSIKNSHRKGGLADLPFRQGFNYFVVAGAACFAAAAAFSFAAYAACAGTKDSITESRLNDAAF